MGTLKQMWASLYMLFFNMPWLPEFLMLANNAWMVGRFMLEKEIPKWKVHLYRANCLQRGAMTAQLNYYRSAIQKAPKPDNADVLGPRKDGKPVRRLALPVLMIGGKDDGALPEAVFSGYERYLSNARLVMFSDCSHWITTDCSDKVNDEIE